MNNNHSEYTLPWVFHASPWPRRWLALCVGVSVAGVLVVHLAALALPTVLFVTAWAALALGAAMKRNRLDASRGAASAPAKASRSVRYCIPAGAGLAMGNAAVTALLMFAPVIGGDMWPLRAGLAMIHGGSFGAVIWVPAFFIVLWVWGRGALSTALRQVTGELPDEALVMAAARNVVVINLLGAASWLLLGAANHVDATWFRDMLAPAAVASIPPVALAGVLFWRARRRRHFLRVMTSAQPQRFTVANMAGHHMLCEVSHVGEPPYREERVITPVLRLCAEDVESAAIT